MKTNNSIYSLLLGGVLFLFACQKTDIVSAPAKVAAVSNFKYALENDSVMLSWSLPQGYESLTVELNDGASTKTLSPNATSFKYGIVETNKDYAFTVKLKDGKGNISLGEVVNFKREGAAPVKDVSGEQNDNGVLLTWTAPAMPVSKIQIKFGNQTVEAGPSATSYQFNNVPIGSYTIAIVTTNSSNQTSNTVYLPFKVGATAVAYLSMAADSTTMLATADDDIVTGAKWLFSTYPKSRYISFDMIKNGTVDLSQYRVIWWNYDVQTGHALPAVSTDATVVAKMTAFYKNGGNLLLNQYALQYFKTLGRMTEPYFMEYGNGDGFSNGDTWGIGVKIGRKQDKRNHPLHKGIVITETPDGRVTFPILGPGHRENHNAVIIRIPEYLKLEPNDNDAAYEKFSSDNNLEWLGQWDGMGDYWMVGNFELKPTTLYQGSAIFIGVGAIEWNQNSGTNIYQSNVEKMYKNAIDYLKTK